MNIANVAKILLEIRRRASPIVLVGELQDRLGVDGFSEALKRKWLVYDSDHGSTLMITTLQIFVNEMETVAGQHQPPSDDEDADVGDTVIVSDAGRTYQGVIKSKKLDPTGKGQFDISFTGERPPGNRPFNRNELRLVAKTKAKVPPNSQPVAQQPFEHPRY